MLGSTLINMINSKLMATKNEEHIIENDNLNYIKGIKEKKGERWKRNKSQASMHQFQRTNKE